MGYIMNPMPIEGTESLETLDLLTTGITTLTVPDECIRTSIYISVAANTTVNGETPATGIVGTGYGFPIPAGQYFWLTRSEAKAFQAIAQTTDGILIAWHER